MKKTPLLINEITIPGKYGKEMVNKRFLINSQNAKILNIDILDRPVGNASPKSIKSKKLESPLNVLSLRKKIYPQKSLIMSMRRRKKKSSEKKVGQYLGTFVVEGNI
jgi:hypothetical protein